MKNRAHAAGCWISSSSSICVGGSRIPRRPIKASIIKILRCECERHEASPLQRAIDIRVYVEAVKSTAAREIPSISLEEIERWAKWALEQADRIDPVRSARFMDVFDESDDAK